ncbi:MAG: hypothetical protein KCHDKBKB_02384 [Elusimicrobia bacterium]|nr:hypothetical protein [Elusimicrobiota bacterium]
MKSVCRGGDDSARPFGRPQLIFIQCEGDSGRRNFHIRCPINRASDEADGVTGQTIERGQGAGPGAAGQRHPFRNIACGTPINGRGRIRNPKLIVARYPRARVPIPRQIGRGRAINMQINIVCFPRIGTCPDIRTRPLDCCQ